jgi:hypothetical protein
MSLHPFQRDASFIFFVTLIELVCQVNEVGLFVLVIQLSDANI